MLMLGMIVLDDSSDKYKMTVTTNIDVCEKRHILFCFAPGEHHNVS